MKKTIISILVIMCMLLCIIPVSADVVQGTDSFSMLNLNVAGLPDFNRLLGKSDAVDVKAKEKVLGGILEESGFDFIAVQEDFNYHKALSGEMKSYKYVTKHSGGVPFGDGLNIYSKTSVYNTEREEWRTRFGVYVEGDELTPKGILYSVIEIADGVYADFYDIHADAFDTEGSKDARIDNYKQLAEMIKKHNSDRPVIITGDYNISFHHAPYERSGKALKEIFIDDLGFKDSWIEVNNGGDYSDFSKWENGGVSYWGNWDSVERFLYKDGNGIHLEASECAYICYKDGEGNALSDHNGCYVKFDYTLGDTFKAESKNDFKVSRINPFKEIARRINYIFKTLKICLSNLDELKEILAANK